MMDVNDCFLCSVQLHLREPWGHAPAPPHLLPPPLADDDGVGGAGCQVPDVDHPPGHVTFETRA